MKDRKLENQIICPSCKSKNVAEYLYGMPSFSKKLEKELEQRKVILGGCCQKIDAPLFHCNDCGKEWGKEV